jgi:AbrB family looped-hinge helix DNA binding protein
MAAVFQKSRTNVRIGKRGTIVIPADIRHQLGLEEGDVMTLSVGQDGAMSLKAIEADPGKRLRDAIHHAFAGVDPVAYQRASRDEDDE